MFSSDVYFSTSPSGVCGKPEITPSRWDRINQIVKRGIFLKCFIHATLKQTLIGIYNPGNSRFQKLAPMTIRLLSQFATFILDNSRAGVTVRKTRPT